MINLDLIASDKARAAAQKLYDEFVEQGLIDPTDIPWEIPARGGVSYHYANDTIFTVYHDGYFARPAGQVAYLWHYGDDGGPQRATKAEHEIRMIGPARGVYYAAARGDD